MNVINYLKTKCRFFIIKYFNLSHIKDIENRDIHPDFDISSHLNKILQNPTKATLHFELAIASYSEGLYFLAFSSLQSGRFLSQNKINSKADKYENLILESLEDPLYMDHNQYYRYMSLKNELIKKAGNDNFSVLDVGGGHGQLASFIPQAKYFLVEPSVNGICGLTIPFDDNTFDFVVSCHVFEHIQEKNRLTFLNNLISKARKGVILLNPFYAKNIPDEEQLKLLIDITSADWAKEHLECGLPLLSDIQSYADKKGIQVEITPNGTMATTTAMVFTSFFATRLGEVEKLKKINKMFNESFLNILDSESAPTAYLIYFDLEN